MHAALKIDDILTEIFDYLTPPLVHSRYHLRDCDPDRKALKTPYNAALTCKAFSAPALKQLWTHVPTLDALLGLLPSSVKVVSDIHIHDRDNPAPDILPNEHSVWVCGLHDKRLVLL